MLRAVNFLAAACSDLSSALSCASNAVSSSSLAVMRCRLEMAASTEALALREPPDMVPAGLNRSPWYDTLFCRICLSKVTRFAESPS